MVHRPSDSRLLTNLTNHEKEYSKSLLSLLDTSHASLASFQAYASASSPPTSYKILAVAGSFAGADEALRRYAQSVDRWRADLGELKKLEDEVGNVIRDREILVSRLIKASKSQKPTRESLLPSTTASVTSLTLSVSSNPSSKLTAAQAELQACEAHLASKERELDDRRSSTVREGLNVRCKAMVECGWVWGEMGKEGLRALQSDMAGEGSTQIPLPFPAQSSSSSSSHQHSSSMQQNQFHKPLPDPHRQSSDLSIAPSQSASQISLPAAYKMDEYVPVVPTGGSLEGGYEESGGDRGRHILSRRITEESLHVTEREETESSAEDIGPVEIVENPQFSTFRSSKSAGDKAAKLSTLGRQRKFSIRGSKQADAGRVPPSPTAAYESRRERRASASGFLGSIMGMFRGKTKDGSEGGSDISGGHGHEEWERVGDGTIGKGAKWKTRTDHNIKVGSRRGGVSDGEDNRLGKPGVGSVRRKTLSKEKPAGVGVGVDASMRRAEEWIGGQSSFAERENDRWGVGGDEDGEGTIKPRKRRKASLTKVNTKLNGELGEGSVSLSRNSSITSAATAPPAFKSSAFGMPSARSPSAPTSQPKRSSSMRVPAKTKQDRRGSLPVNGMGPTEASMSLMSIVEGVTNANRQGWDSLNPTSSMIHQPSSSSNARSTTGGSSSKAPVLMEVPKAPGGTSGGMHLPKAPPPMKKGELEGSSFVVVKGSRLSNGTERVRTSSLPSRTGLPGINGLPSTSTAISGLPEAKSSLDGLDSLRVTRPAKSPLRSALRTSRSPSPLAQPSTSVLDPNVAGSSSKAQPSLPNGVELEEDADDGASMSSYETGHEAFDTLDNEKDPDDEDERPPLPPPHHETESDLSDASTSTPTHAPIMSSTADTNGTQRRKSVRISKQPTFSPTPPALDDDETSYAWGSGATPDAGGWPSRVDKEERGRDMWEDSSDEDAEYTRARRLLGRVAKKALEKGKGRER